MDMSTDGIDGRTVEYGAQNVCHSWRCWSSRIPHTLFNTDPTWTPLFILERSAGAGSHLSVIRAPPCSQKLNFLLPLPSLSPFLSTNYCFSLFVCLSVILSVMSLRLCQLRINPTIVFTPFSKMADLTCHPEWADGAGFSYPWFWTPCSKKWKFPTFDPLPLSLVPLLSLAYLCTVSRGERVSGGVNSQRAHMYRV
jgi:hypothetical protein